MAQGEILSLDPQHLLQVPRLLQQDEGKGRGMPRGIQAS